MKKLILFLSLALAVSFANAQQKTDVKKDDGKKVDEKKMQPKENASAASTAAPAVDVPAAIKTKFASYYPNVKDAVWKEEKESYVASFEQNKVKTSVVFDSAGNLAETRTDTKTGDLPDKVSTYVKKNMGKSAKIKKATKITDAKGVVTYETLINDKTEVFDGKGKYLGQSDEK